MRADLATGLLTEAHDKLLDIIADFLVSEYLDETGGETTYAHRREDESRKAGVR